MKEKSIKGITLVALVITIVILLILAGISIQLITNTGLFENAKEAKKQSEIANVKEQIQLEIYAKQAESIGEITEYDLKSILENYGTINYEENGTTIKGITTEKGYEIDISDIYTGGLTEEKLVANGTWQNVKKVNSPELLTGMTPIKFTEPEDNKEGETEKTTYTDKNWYDYPTKKWANAQTEDGSMWVWIPRYAYKINSSTQTCDIVFLIGTTDNYYDENGKIQTAKRQKTADETIDTTTGYTVHPAFTNESSINYANGGWDKELSGIWVAKFEAGYAGGNNSAPKGVSSEVKYTQSTVYATSVENETKKEGEISARNWTDGVYGATETIIKYPTFQGLTYSMNYINHNDAFNISKSLTGKNNIYGLNPNNADSHLMKNSEWGAIAYLSQSKYGLDGTNIVINNVNLNNSTKSVYAVTGCASSTADASAVSTTSVYAVTGCSATAENADVSEVGTTIEKLNNRTETNAYVWTQKNGTKASSTGTIYGIYDMSGGIWERSAAIVNNGNSNLTTFGKSLMNSLINGKSSQYVTVYPYDSSVDKTGANPNTVSAANYAKNTKIYGDGIRETSTAGTGKTSWYTDYSCFPAVGSLFFVRGDDLWDGEGAGLFYFNRTDGRSIFDGGFRSVLVAL